MFSVLLIAKVNEQIKELGSGLARRGFTCSIASDGEKAVEKVIEQAPDLVLVDIDGSPASSGRWHLAQGIKQMVMPEHPVQPAAKTFPQSGILAVAKSNGVPMIDMRSDEKLFKEIEAPKGKRLKKALVTRDVLETDALVNMPVAKHHGGAGLTMAMKNWLGAVQDRRFLHRNDLHQCIADLGTIIRPTWSIVDATRIMLDRGPKGPSKNMKQLDLLVVGKDQVAVDAYTATLFPAATAARAKYIQMAAEMKLGCADLAKIAVHKTEVS